MTIVISLAVAVLSLLGGVAAFAADPQAQRPAPEGWGRAQLGMQLTEFRRLYPQSEEAPALPGLSLDGRVRREVVWKVRAEGLTKPVDLEFRFWDGKLWMILVYANQVPGAELRSFLEARFGAPTLASEKPSWMWPRVKVVAEPQQGWFAIFDRDLGKQVQAAMYPTPASGEPKPKAP